MLCSLLQRCIYTVKNIDQAGKSPVFESITGSTEEPGVLETIFMDRPVSVYEVFTVPEDRIFVLEYISAVVTRGDGLGYPSEYMNDYGEAGFVVDDHHCFHTVPFTRSEPGGMLHSSQTIRLYIPARARVVVKVPLVPNQSGGATIRVSGYYINS